MSLQELYVRYETVLRPLLRTGPILGGAALLVWRLRETRVPVSIRSIVIPPLAMSSGFLMFLAPAMRVSWSWALIALVVGFLVLSWPLVRSSRLELRDGAVHMKRSPAFLSILLGLLVIRLLLHDYIGHFVSPLHTASLLYLLAFGMIARWRGVMYVQFHRIAAEGRGVVTP